MSQRAHIAVAVAALVAWASPACRHHLNPATPEELAWDAHHEAEREGRLDEAIAGYRAQCDAKPPYSRSCYDLARALFEAGRHAEARDAAARFIAEHPSDALAPTASKALARSFTDAGEEAVGIAVLEDLAAGARGKDVWDSLQFQIARLFRSAGDPAGEAAALERIVAMDRWKSQLWNDALWRLVEIAHEGGDVKREKSLLGKMIDSREESRLIGSYDSKYHDDALLGLGKLELEDGRLDRAYSLFMQLAGWKTSRMRDDGYYWAAVVRARQGRKGDVCDLLRRLEENVPSSSSADEAAALARETGCHATGAGEGKGQ